MFEFYVTSNKIELLVSVKAVQFYRKFEYDYKNGIKKLDKEHHHSLKKFKETDLK